MPILKHRGLADLTAAPRPQDLRSAESNSCQRVPFLSPAACRFWERHVRLTEDVTGAAAFACSSAVWETSLALLAGVMELASVKTTGFRRQTQRSRENFSDLRMAAEVRRMEVGIEMRNAAFMGCAPWIVQRYRHRVRFCNPNVAFRTKDSTVVGPVFGPLGGCLGHVAACHRWPFRVSWPLRDRPDRLTFADLRDPSERGTW